MIRTPLPRKGALIRCYACAPWGSNPEPTDSKAFQGCADGDSWHIAAGRTTLNTTDLPGVVEFRPTASHGIWRRLPSPPPWIAVG